jgi:hypothetical protein
MVKVCLVCGYRIMINTLRVTPKERYIGIVVSSIKKNDVAFNVLVPEGINRFVREDYYVTKFMGMTYVNPMAFFNGVNWYEISGRIRNKYGVSDRDQLDTIKEKLEEYFIENH